VSDNLFAARRLGLTTSLSGRLLSEVFMDYPSKKMWPQYYLQIKQPRCLEVIQVRWISFPATGLRYTRKKSNGKST
jgi:hypothetical protein